MLRIILFLSLAGLTYGQGRPPGTSNARSIQGVKVCAPLTLTDTYLLSYSSSSNCLQLSAATSTTPGGSTTQIQYNNSGSFAGGAGLTTSNGSAFTIPTGGSLTVSGLGTINSTSLGGTAAASYPTGATNLITAGAVPYVSASGVLNQDASYFAYDVATHKLTVGLADGSFPSPATHISVRDGVYEMDIGSTSIQVNDQFILQGGSGVRIREGGISLIQLTTGFNLCLGKENQACAGTVHIQDTTATTGSTLVTIALGAADTSSTKQLDLSGAVKFGGSNSTAAVAGVVGVTCPAVTCTAAYTWVKAIAADNSVVYFPVWK